MRKETEDYGEDVVIPAESTSRVQEKKKTKSVSLVHNLHQIEAVQLINLAPKTVKEAKTLIPTLQKLTYDQLWYYVDVINQYVKVEEEDAAFSTSDANPGKGTLGDATTLMAGERFRFRQQSDNLKSLAAKLGLDKNQNVAGANG